MEMVQDQPIDTNCSVCLKLMASPHLFVLCRLFPEPACCSVVFNTYDTFYNVLCIGILIYIVFMTLALTPKPHNTLVLKYRGSIYKIFTPLHIV